ncbi:MAG: hypothetical protein ACLGGX_06140 [Bdellovibrionia bacterium]
MKIAFINGANPHIQKYILNHFSSEHQFYLIDDLKESTSENIKIGTLIKRSPTEYGPIEMALKKENIDSFYHFPLMAQNASPVVIEEALFNQTLGLLKVCDKLQLKLFAFIMDPQQPEIVYQSTLNMLNKIKLNSSLKIKIETLL